MSSLTPQQLGKRIRDVRMERGLSQDDLGKALGLHRQSISLIERGKRDLTAVELDELTRFLQIPYGDIMAPKTRRVNKKGGSSQSAFRPEKLRQMLLSLLEEVGGRPNVGETVLYKLLYFCDFNHYEKTGKSISGMTYRRLQFGPVPQLNQFLPVIETMVKNRQLERIEHEYFGKPQTRYIALRDPSEDVLNNEEKSTIKEVAGKLGMMNATQIEEYVHGDVPWEATDHQKPIQYELVHWRTEPYAICSAPEMLRRAQCAGAEDVLSTIEPMSEEEITYYELLSDARNV